jgi:hypothetical protein
MNTFSKKKNLEEFQRMENICDKIILVTKYENYIYTSKLSLWVKFIYFILFGEWNDIE